MNFLIADTFTDSLAQLRFLTALGARQPDRQPYRILTCLGPPNFDVF